MDRAPPLVSLADRLSWCPARHTTARYTCFRWLVFVLTFVTYTSFHASRKPISVVKNALNGDCSHRLAPATVNTSVNPHWCDWPPFDGPDSNTLLGLLDSSYLFSYAVFMYFSGMLAERMDLRYFLSLTMLGSALLTWAFGAAYYWQIHSLFYFIGVQVVCGVFQAGGWPGVVAVMSNWQKAGKRGLVFGLWNSHTSVGNIVGTLMASAFVATNWGLSFIVPALFIGGAAIMNFLLLTPYPEEVACTGLQSLTEDEDSGSENSAGGGDDGEFSTPRCPPDSTAAASAVGSLTSPASNSDVCDDAVAFTDALRISGVVQFSASLFFAKLVSYTFLYWLPRYLHSAAGYSASESASLSTLFDVGGVVGGVLAGVMSDKWSAPALVCLALLLLAIPAMYLLQLVASYSHLLNSVMLVVVGVLVNGPYALITTAVAADLGSSLPSRAMATVTAIIDGTGSLGAAAGPLLAGAVSAGGQWTHVFYMLMSSSALAMLCLIGVARKEWHDLRRARRQ